MKRNPGWTSEELAQIRDGLSDIPPGRTHAAAKHQRAKFRMVEAGPPIRIWTESEIALLRANKAVPGRSRWAVNGKRLELGITARRERPQVPWSDAEIAKLRLFHGRMAPVDYVTHFPGRTVEGIRSRANRRLGAHGVNAMLVIASRRASIARPTIILRNSAADLMTALDRAVPRSLPHHVRSDVIGDLALRFLEGDMDPRDLPRQVRLALTAHYRMHPVMGAPVSLDAPMFDHGPTLAERLHRGLWD